MLFTCSRQLSGRCRSKLGSSYLEARHWRVMISVKLNIQDSINTNMNERPSKTKTSFYRRIYLAYLIDNGINTVPAIMGATGIPKRTAQDTILAMRELGIKVEFVGEKKNGNYVINDWGAIFKDWVENNLQHVKCVLEYP